MDGGVLWVTDQDFQLGTTCVEVKTSTAANLDRLNDLRRTAA